MRNLKIKKKRKKEGNFEPNVGVLKMGFGPSGGGGGNGEYKHVMFECWEHWKEDKSWPDMMMSVTACDAIMCLPLFLDILS